MPDRVQSPAPKFNQIETHPTPDVADVLFWELRDRNIPSNRIRTYGDAHPNPLKWPNHTLVYVEPDDRDGFERWWYGATRSAQERYNYEIEYPYCGNTSFPRYKRAFVLLRSTYTPLALGSADPGNASAVLLEPEIVTNAGDEKIESLYIKVIRVFGVLPTKAQQIACNYEADLECSEGEKVVWSYDVRVSAYAPTACGAACPIAGFGDLKAITEKFTPYNSYYGKAVVTFQAINEWTAYDMPATEHYSSVRMWRAIVLVSSLPVAAKGGTWNTTEKVVDVSYKPINCCVAEATVLTGTPCERDTFETDDIWGKVKVIRYRSFSSGISLPCIGDAKGSYYVVAAKVEEVDCSGEYEVTLTLADDLESPDKSSMETDDVWCSIERHTVYQIAKDDTPFYEVGEKVRGFLVIGDEGDRYVVFYTMTEVNPGHCSGGKSLWKHEYGLAALPAAKVEKRYDDALDTVLTFTSTIHLVDDYEEPVLLPGQSFSTRPLGCAFLVETIRSVGTIPDLSFYSWGEFSFPGLLLGFNETSVYEDADECGHFRVDPRVEAAKTRKTLLRHDVTYQDEEPDLSAEDIFEFEPVDVVYDGILFGLGLRNMLTESGASLTATTGNADGCKPFLVETYNVPVSNPTVTEFYAMKGTFVLVAVDTKKNEFRKWQVTRTYAKF